MPIKLNEVDKALSVSKSHALYRENNRSEIQARGKVKVLCVCGCVHAKTNISHHVKSKKHLALMQLISIGL
jgi:hypothetical protein